LANKIRQDYPGSQIIQTGEQGRLGIGQDNGPAFIQTSRPKSAAAAMDGHLALAFGIGIGIGTGLTFP
jgi:hypothetical protein